MVAVLNNTERKMKERMERGDMGREKRMEERGGEKGNKFGGGKFHIASIH